MLTITQLFCYNTAKWWLSYPPLSSRFLRGDSPSRIQCGQYETAASSEVKQFPNNRKNLRQSKIIVWPKILLTSSKICNVDTTFHWRSSRRLSRPLYVTQRLFSWCLCEFYQVICSCKSKGSTTISPSVMWSHCILYRPDFWWAVESHGSVTWSCHDSHGAMGLRLTLSDFV